MKKGFTILEVLVVLLIVALLSYIILFSASQTDTEGKALQVQNDLLNIKRGLSLYAYDNSGRYPCHDHDWDDTFERSELSPYIDWPTHPFASTNNQYHLEHGSVGYTYSISIRDVRTTENAQAIDDLMDDGDLSTGLIRGTSARLEYYGLDQPRELIDCHG